MQPYFLEENPGAFHGANAIAGFQSITSKLSGFKIAPHGQFVQPQELVALKRTRNGVQSIFIEQEIQSKQFDIIFSALSPKALKDIDLPALLIKLESFASEYKFSFVEDGDKSELFLGAVSLPDLDFAFNASKKELEAVFDGLQAEAVRLYDIATKSF